jgi:serine/threonine protein kinase/ABC-type glycerol-3-phosphate transport system substrate-binding protein
MGDSEFGRFHLLERIGAGGMGEVFRAEMRGPDGFSRVVVVKRMLPDLASEADAVTSFIHEAKLAARIVHPNVVQVYDFGKVGQRYFLVMEYVAGCDLARLLAIHRDAKRRLPPSVAITIVAALLEGLEFAHALRDADGAPLYLVHRDVTPANVLLGTAGEIKLSDFGIAKTRERLGQTRAGAVKGKWNYMSPEQTKGVALLDARSDLFAVGVVLYELVTGERPFKGKNGTEIAIAIQSGRYPPMTDVPDGLVEVVKRALQVKIEDRFQSARGFREVLLARAAREGITPDVELLRKLVDEAAMAFASHQMPTRPERPKAQEPAPVSDREPTEVVGDDADAAPTAPASRPPPTPQDPPPSRAPTAPPPVSIGPGSISAAAVSTSAPSGNTVSLVIRPRHFALGGVALVALIVATFAIAARMSHTDKQPEVVRIALRMYPAQERWFKEQVFDPFADRENCKVEIVEFNSTEELSRILANGEADVAKVDIEHAPLLVELGRLQRISALADRVDRKAYEELVSGLRPEALKLGQFHTMTGDDLYLLPRKLETAQLVYRPSLVELAAAEFPNQRAALDAKLHAAVGHGLPDGYVLDRDPAKWTTLDVVAAAWVWAHTPIDGTTEPRYAIRAEKRALMEAVSGGASSEPWHVSAAMVDVFYGYAVMRELGVLRPESFATEADFAKLRDMLAHKALAAFIEVQIDVGILVGNGKGLPQLIDDPKDWDVAPLPRLASLDRADGTAASESRSEVWGWGWGVPRNSRQPELAMRLILDILSQDRHAAELEQFTILRVRKDTTPAWQPSKRVNDVGDIQLANGKGRFVDWPKRPGEIEKIEARIDRAYRDIIVDRRYKGPDGTIDRALIETRLHKFLDGD